MDEGVAALLREYAALQGEFKEAHKALERASAGAGGKAAPSDVKAELLQLQDERRQLVEKIAALKRRTADIPSFSALLGATSSLRKEQEEEARLGERMGEQRAALIASERRYADVNRRLAEARAGAREDVTGEEVLAAARREAADEAQLAEKVLPASLEARCETLARLRKALAEPSKSEAELYGKRAEAESLVRAVAGLTRDVAAAQRAAGDDKLAMHRQQAALVARTLATKEEGLEVALREGAALAREGEAKEAKLSQLSGPRFMRKEEFKAYAAGLRAKTAAFKHLLGELGALKAETAVLVRTEVILRSRAGDRDAFLRKQEEKKGIAGYTAVATDLEKVSSLKARIDESKGATLAEISRIVDDINAAIAERKTRLAPVIAQLRASRGEYSEVEARHTKERATFDSVAAGLGAERAAAEAAAAAAAADADAEEGRVTSLRSATAAAGALLERSKAEAGYESGSGRHNGEYRTQKEALAAALAAAEVSTRALRKQQKELKESSSDHASQRATFAGLQRLLRVKLEAAGGRSARRGGNDEGSPGTTSELTMGSARVMQLQRA